MIGQSGRWSPSQQCGEVGEGGAHLAQQRDLLVEFGEVAQGQRLDVALERLRSPQRRSRSRISSIEKPRSRARRMKPRRWTSSVAVVAIVGIATVGGRDQADQFVVADHLGRYAGCRAGFADLHCGRLLKRLDLTMMGRCISNVKRATASRSETTHGRTSIIRRQPARKRRSIRLRNGRRSQRRRDRQRCAARPTISAREGCRTKFVADPDKYLNATPFVLPPRRRARSAMRMHRHHAARSRPRGRLPPPLPPGTQVDLPDASGDRAAMDRAIARSAAWRSSRWWRRSTTARIPSWSISRGG